MSFINPPEWASVQSRKRRADFDDDDDNDDGDGYSADKFAAVGARQRFAHSINPLSHSEDTLIQMNLAGLPESAELPSRTHRNFPHKALPEKRSRLTGNASDDEDAAENEPPNTGDGDGEGDEAAPPDAPDGTCRATDGRAAKPQNLARHSKSRSRSRANGTARSTSASAGTGPEAEARRYLDPMLDAIHILLDRGAVARAQRLFAAMLRLPPLDDVEARMDVRRSGMWAIGAELLMRAGEEERVRVEAEAEAEGRGVRGRRVGRRWGCTRNMPRVREYFQQLILQYPWKLSTSSGLTAKDFWLALLSCEVYDAHIEHVLAQEDIKAQAAQADSDAAEDPDGGPLRRSTVEEQEEALRARTFAGFSAVLKPVHEMMERLPYARDPQINHMYATALLFAADVTVPAAGQGGGARERNEARRERVRLRGLARASLVKAMDRGVEVNAQVQESLGIGEWADSEDEDGGEAVDFEPESEEEDEEVQDDEDEDENENDQESENEEEYNDEDSNLTNNSLPIRSKS
ncbi:hypothetical protein BROUX41_004537 [Berkeleyomyces rouxiae]|uniref:uncharacterized protein n=1 Tax=Berkeleyomyces rouxiae TaxID=2035830 RepID=UPI003B813352